MQQLLVFGHAKISTVMWHIWIKICSFSDFICWWMLFFVDKHNWCENILKINTLWCTFFFVWLQFVIGLNFFFCIIMNISLTGKSEIHTGEVALDFLNHSSILLVIKSLLQFVIFSLIRVTAVEYLTCFLEKKSQFIWINFLEQSLKRFLLIC